MGDYERGLATLQSARATASHIERRIARAEATIERELLVIDRLSSLPEEPEVTDKDGALVIWFQRQFTPGGTLYTYAAVKAGDGLWYTTGPQSPKGYTWDNLMSWMMRNNNGTVDARIWIATEWSAWS